jgi:hypothetical protein
VTTEEEHPEESPDEVGVHFVSPLTVRQLSGSHKWWGVAFAALALGLLLVVISLIGVNNERATRLRVQDSRIAQLSAESSCRAALSADIDVVFLDAFLYVLNRPIDPAQQTAALSKLLAEVNAARERRTRTDEICRADTSATP